LSVLRYHALLARVPDIAPADAFYGGRLGLSCTVLADGFHRARDSADALLYLEVVTPAPGPVPDQARATATFLVGDVEKSIATLAAARVEFLQTAPQHARSGLYIRFRDPFGNVHSLVQLREPPSFEIPRIYRAGIKIPIASVPAAKRLYGDTLGFAIESERHYPPLVPLIHRDGSPAFTVEDKENWERDLRVRAPRYPDETGVVMVLETPDLAETRRELSSRMPGLALTPAAPFALGQRMALIDMAGLATEIWEIAR
jgi:catechol 2,3-dioxygenase-like lactoylglutathione lyase family enzyme